MKHHVAVDVDNKTSEAACNVMMTRWFSCVEASKAWIQDKGGKAIGSVPREQWGLLNIRSIGTRADAYQNEVQGWL